MKCLLLALTLCTILNSCYKPIIDNSPSIPYTPPAWTDAPVTGLYLESAKPITDTAGNCVSYFALLESAKNKNGHNVENIKGIYEHDVDTVKNNSSLQFKGYWITPTNISSNKSGTLIFFTYKLSYKQLLYAKTPYDKYMYNVTGYGLTVTFKYGGANDLLPDSIVVDRMNWLLKKTDNIAYRNY